jgi:Domain of unknown function (DUF3291)
MMHLAELNIGKFKYPTTDVRMAGFMDNLDRINALADRAEGFVWRLKSDGSNNATDLRYGDNDFAINMSVWKDAQSLENYVFRTAHVQIYKKRAEWFELMGKPHMVFWWVPEGYIPPLSEAIDKLEFYEKNGASEEAFGWAEVMDVERMRSLRCA